MVGRLQALSMKSMPIEQMLFYVLLYLTVVILQLCLAMQRIDKIVSIIY